MVTLLLIMQPTCSKLVRNVHTHEAWRVGLVSPNLPINQNMSLHQNGNDLTVCEGILQPVPQNKHQWQALPGFVGARWWLRSLHRELENIIHHWEEDQKTKETKFKTSKDYAEHFTHKCAPKFVKHPMFWSIEPLQMLLQTPSL